MFICLRCKGTYFILYMQVIIEILILFNSSVKEKLKRKKDLLMSSKMITFVVGRKPSQDSSHPPQHVGIKKTCDLSQATRFKNHEKQN